MGVATIQAQTALQLRVDPESIQFGYILNSKTEETYGGKVIQILSTTITDLTIPCVSGAGGRQYLAQVARFFREMMIWQRDSQNFATFSYPPRNYNLHVYAAAFTIQDQMENITFPFTMKFKVSEDAGGVASGAIMQAEIDKLKDGVGYTKNKYNDPLANPPPPVPATDPNGGAQPGGGAAPAAPAPAAPTTSGGASGAPGGAPR